MGGYLEGSKVIALSDLLTGRNKLHLRRELCVVSEGLHGEKKKRKGKEKITLVGNRVCKSYQNGKRRQVLFGNTFCKMVQSLNCDAAIFSTEYFFFFFCRTKGVMAIFRVLSTPDSGTLNSLFTVSKVLRELLSTSQGSTTGR